MGNQEHGASKLTYVMVSSRLVAGRRVPQVLAGPSDINLLVQATSEGRVPACQGYPFGNWREQLPRHCSLSGSS